MEAGFKGVPDGKMALGRVHAIHIWQNCDISYIFSDKACLINQSRGLSSAGLWAENQFGHDITVWQKLDSLCT